MFQFETLAARQSCRHCRGRAQGLETELRRMLRDPAVPRQTRMGAFRAVVALRINELALEYRQRDLTALGALLTDCFTGPTVEARAA